jgi:hypothetical protein
VWGRHLFFSGYTKWLNDHSVSHHPTSEISITNRISLQIKTWSSRPLRPFRPFR